MTITLLDQHCINNIGYSMIRYIIFNVLFVFIFGFILITPFIIIFGEISCNDYMESYPYSFVATFFGTLLSVLLDFNKKIYLIKPNFFRYFKKHILFSIAFYLLIMFRNFVTYMS